MSAGNVRAAVTPRRFFSELLARPDHEDEDDDPVEADDSPYCCCNLEPTIEEADSGVCDACGKPLCP